ncbi:MAG: hypothetical protein IJO54_08665 [Oscillospiraceae bacterium]|nr:hypothetical protein [Oscillospiraceae bacterium]
MKKLIDRLAQTHDLGHSELLQLIEMDNPEAEEYLDLDVNAVKDMFAYYDFDMTIRDSDIAAMESTMKFLLETGMIENTVDINSLVIR